MPVKPSQGLLLALGGGGARGLAHVGVIQALEECGWIPDAVAGSSMGAVIGALYARLGSAAELKSRSLEVISSKDFQNFGLEKVVSPPMRGSRGESDWNAHLRRLITLIRMGHSQALFNTGSLLRLMRSAFGNITFKQLRIPFTAIATDLYSGMDVTLSNGDVASAVAASSAIPGVFEPLRRGKMLLVDGCITRNVPTPINRAEESRYVLAVSVPWELANPGPFYHAVDVMARAEVITQRHLEQTHLLRADGIITPQVMHIHWADFNRVEDLIEAGYQAAREFLRSASI